MLLSFGLLGAALHAAPPASELPTAFAELRAKDTRVARIGYALVTGNAAFCSDLTPATGLLLHDLATYGSGSAMRGALGLSGDFGIQAVVPGSPAAQAGLVPDMTVQSIAGLAVDDLPIDPAKRWQRLETVQLAMQEQLQTTGALTLQLAGKDAAVTLAGTPACSSRFEVGPLGKRAVADGSRIVIGEDFPGHGWADELLAAVIAHELAHNILHHRAWLDARGRKRKDIRVTEREADRLAPWLLANAGYEPSAALRFMQTWGPDYSGGWLLRKRTHDGWDERADAMAAEIPLVEAQLAASGKADWRTYFRREIALSD